MVGVGSRAGTAARWFGLLIAAVLVLLIAAQSSQARKRVEVTINGHVKLEGGIRVDVTADGESGPDKVYLGVSRGDQGSYLSTYYQPQAKPRPSSGRRIISGLGERGSMRLSFVPRGKPEVDREGCLSLSQRDGVLEGYLHFRGERRYVHVVEHELRATRYKLAYKVDCRPRARERRRIIELTSCTSEGTQFHALSGFPPA